MAEEKGAKAIFTNEKSSRLIEFVKTNELLSTRKKASLRKQLWTAISENLQENGVFKYIKNNN